MLIRYNFFLFFPPTHKEREADLFHPTLLKAVRARAVAALNRKKEKRNTRGREKKENRRKKGWKRMWNLYVGVGEEDVLRDLCAFIILLRRET